LRPAAVQVNDGDSESKITVAAEGERELAPKHEDQYNFYVETGEKLYQENNISEAEKAFGKALSIRPNAPRALVGIGYTELDKGHDHEALLKFQKAAPQEWPEAYFGLGDAYRKLERDREAIEAYQSYLKKGTNDELLSIAQRYIQKLRRKETQKKGI
jgi:tetratricopeptide (TPR) repeat protein